jgi:tyrosyl-tRNA synthetase
MSHIECKAQTLVDMVIMCKFAKSKTQARQLIESGAIRIQDVKITNPSALIAWNADRTEAYVINDYDKK